MIILSGSTNSCLAKSIALKMNVLLIIADIKSFSNQELHISIEGVFENQDVVIVQSIASSANDNLMELLLIADAVKKRSAKSVTALIPYFGYSRHDDFASKNSIQPLRLIAKLMKASGINKIITLDIHSKKIEELLDIKFINLDSIALISNILKDQENVILVSPDEGGADRVENIAHHLKLDFAVMHKVRTPKAKCIINSISKNVIGKDCFIIDDIIDSGNTICAAFDFLKNNGASSISFFATHAVLASQENILKIVEKPFNNMYITYSFVHKQPIEKIKVLSIADLFAKALKDINY